jgi:hypothetical protein
MSAGAERSQLPGSDFNSPHGSWISIFLNSAETWQAIVEKSNTIAFAQRMRVKFLSTWEICIRWDDGRFSIVLPIVLMADM